MKTADELIDDILRREGGFVNHPDDPGGATNHGITIGTLRQWRGKAVSVEDVKNLSVEEARLIYNALYVKPFLGAGLPVDVLPFLVDLGVHSGVGAAQRLLHAARVRVEKGLPPMSPLLRALIHERLAFMSAQVKRQPGKLKFLRGWVNRILEFI